MTPAGGPKPERRQELRISIDEPVVVTLLGEQRFSLPGRVVNVSGRGLRIAIPSPLPRGGAIRVDWDNALALAEVRYCVREGNWYVLGVELEHSLPDLAGLAKLADRLMDEAPITVMGPLRKS